MLDLQSDILLSQSKQNSTTLITNTSSLPQTPNSTTRAKPLLHLLKQCTSLSHLKQIHARLIITHPLPFLHHSLTRAYAAAGHLAYATTLLSHPCHPPTHLWNILIQAQSNSSRPQESIHLFRRLLLSGVPDKYTFTFVISSCSRLRAPQLGKAVHGCVLKSGCQWDLYVGNSLVNMYSVIGEMGSARKLFDDMPMRDVITWTSLIRGFVKMEELAVARELFDEMEEPNSVSWAVMIAGYVEHGRYNDAVLLFHDMLRCSDENPNEAVLVCVLSACAHLGALDQGKWIHAYIDRSKLARSSNICTALVDMYAKCGRIDCAKQVFHEIDTRDLLTWTSMISGLAMHGLGDVALAAFHQMVAEGLIPDGIALLGVLNACSHSGLVHEGCSLFYQMKCLWGIVPKIEHYGCLVDLLGRAGQLEKATTIVLKMPMEPDMAIWRALLSACRIHGNVDLGKRILERTPLSNLDSRGGELVLLSNLCATLGRWDDVSKVRSKMNERSVSTRPGCSLIEVNGVVHEFLASDQLHPRLIEIHSKLNEILREVSLKGGYVANTKPVLFDLSEEDKEQAVYWHSEKLAVAFGLMSLEAGCTIRIVKNLRICEDCHSAMKAISHVFCREIVVRDRSRFHTFSDGKCSCMDYW